MSSTTLQNTIPSIADEVTIGHVKKIAYTSLVTRKVKVFEIRVAQFQGQPVLLIDVKGQTTLKNSVFIEKQLLRLVEAQTGCKLAGVFWRFRHESMCKEEPKKACPQRIKGERWKLESVDDELYDVRHLAEGSMEVLEISFNEFSKHSVPITV